MQTGTNVGYVHDAWYVAGWSSEFSQSLTPLVMLEQALVAYRRADGSMSALEDRCPHRQLPLSKGELIADNIRCGYHGMTFNGEGQCIRIPGQDNIPSTAYVRTYPVSEKNSIVFIWMGDPAKANPDDIFDLPQFSNEQWHAHQGDALHLQSHYLNVAENLVDPAHVSFVHPTTLGNAASEDVPVHVDVDSEVLVAWRWIRDAPPVGFFQKFGGFEGHVDRWHYYYLYLPCVAVIDFGSADVSARLEESTRDKGVRIFAIHFLTPVNQHYTIDRWMHLRNAAVGDEQASEQMDAMFRVAFNEDKEILEAIDESERSAQARKPVRLAIDKGPIVYRRRIESLIETEQRQPDPVT